MQVSFKPPHTPQPSIVLLERAIPSQPMQVASLPPQIPHASIMAHEL